LENRPPVLREFANGSSTGQASAMLLDIGDGRGNVEDGNMELTGLLVEER
jgi:hypothetical protein